MRAILGIALSILFISSAAGAEQPAPSSFEQLVEQALRCQATPEGRAYHYVVAKAYQSKLSVGLTYCSQLTRETGRDPFQAVLAIQANGKVSQAEVSPQTNVAKCFRERLLRATFPPPPFAPFYDARNVTFREQE